MSKAATENKLSHLLNKKARYSFLNVPDLEGTVTRTSDTSIWVTFRFPDGYEPTYRFIPHLTSAAPNRWRRYGTDPLAPKLVFI